MTHVKNFLLIFAGCLLGFGIMGLNANAHVSKKTSRIVVESQVNLSGRTMYVTYDTTNGQTCYVVTYGYGVAIDCP